MKNVIGNAALDPLGPLFIVAAFALAAIPGAGGAQSPQVGQREVAMRPIRLSDAEIAIWSDPEFKRRFAESYIAESEIAPRVSEKERRELIAILDLISSNKMNEAGTRLERELTRNEGASAVMDFLLANIHFQSADLPETTDEEKLAALDRAAASYRKAVEKFPRYRQAWGNLGKTHLREAEYEKALAPLTRFIELGGADALTFGLLGHAYTFVENHLSAESAYRMANLLDPASLEWRMGMARSFFKQERHNEAVALLRRLIEENSDRTDLWLLKANAHLGLDQPAEAAQILEIVDLMGASTADSLNLLGDIYVNEDLFTPAVDSYVRAMSESERIDAARPLRSAKALVARGAILETRELLDRIERAAGDALETADRIDLLKLRARLAVADGTGGEEAARTLEEIVALDPLDGEALILLGKHHADAGDAEQAVFYFERAAAIEAHEADAKVRHAELLVGQGKYSQAVPLLRRAQQLNPRSHIQRYLEDVERAARIR